jgi:diguanylate cyclase (GGDEF)-like protein/PAS domain S-box-containing protein
MTGFLPGGSGGGTLIDFEPGSLPAAVFKAAVDSILVIDERGIIQASNPSTQQAFGFAADELLGRNISILMPEPDAQAHDGYLRAYRRGGKAGIIGIGREVMGRRKNGSCFPMHLSVGEFSLDGQRLFVGICHDISERRKFTERISFLASYDSLTGCYNRHQFLQSLGQAMDACEVGGSRLALLFIDMDGFKRVNDSHGHAIGDRLLRQVAERLGKGLRKSDMLGRVGGDEFVVLIEIGERQGVVEELAQRLIDSLAEPFFIEELAIPLRASVGISIFPGYSRSADELMSEADIAMYQAKAEGGGCIRCFTTELREKSEQVYQVVNRLRKAILLEQFELHYQPQFDLRSMRISGLEALLRWRDGDRGLVPPGDFIPVALEYGLMPDIGRWVLRQACGDNAWLIGQGLLDVRVAVNICALLFGQPEFVPQVRRVLRDTGLPGERLELEITEDIAMDDFARVSQHVGELNSAGVRVAMDDFGTGYSSLGRLKGLAFDSLKIDRSFVAGLPDDASGQAIIRAILGIASSMQMQTVAEGIETREQLDHLRAAGCDQGQGFLFARPMPLAQLTEWLRARQA